MSEEQVQKSLDDFSVLIATPHSYETIHKMWFAMFEQLLRPQNSRLYMDPTLPLDKNRNNAVREALNNGYDHILFIDHDNILEPDTLIKLLQYNVPIVGCLYFERQYPHLPLIYTFEEDGQTVRVEYNYPKGLAKCDVIGLGCSLFQTEVFQQLSDPWFCYEHNGQSWGTEDIAFFYKAKERGIPVCVDTENTVGHLTVRTIEEGDWLYYKSGYLQEVSRKANEMGTDIVFLDKTQRVMKPPSARI